MYFIIFVVATSIWVFIDASSIGVKKGQTKGMGDMGPVGWFVASLLLWIIAFPMYLAKRSEFKRAHQSKGPSVAPLSSQDTQPLANVSESQSQDRSRPNRTRTLVSVGLVGAAALAAGAYGMRGYLPGTSHLGLESGSGWTVSRSEDKLTQETVTTASTQSSNDDKSLVGQMTLECRMPSKQLQLAISSFSSTGEGVPLEDDIAVRVRNAAPASSLEMFSGAENSFAAQGMAMSALVTANTLVAPLSAPAANVLQVQLDALLTMLKHRADLLRQAESTIVKERTAHIARGNSLRARRASQGDNDTTAKHLEDLMNEKRRQMGSLSERTMGGGDTSQVALEQASANLEAELDSLYEENGSFLSALGSQEDRSTLARAREFSEFAHTHFGDVASYRSAPDLLRGMGPELVFQYYNRGRSNTLVLRVADVAGFLDHCR